MDMTVVQNQVEGLEWMEVGPDPALDYLEYDGHIGFWKVHDPGRDEDVWTDRFSAIDIACQANPGLEARRGRTFRLDGGRYVNYLNTVIVGRIGELSSQSDLWPKEELEGAEYPHEVFLPEDRVALSTRSNGRLYRLPGDWGALVAPRLKGDGS